MNGADEAMVAYSRRAGGTRARGWQNPTMTILALAMRASERLAEEAKKGNL